MKKYNHTKLKVYRKSVELLYRVYPSLKNFPKYERFSIVSMIKDSFFNLLKFIAMGNSVKSKRVFYLQQADGHLQILKVIFKLCRKMKYISINFHRDIDLTLTEINKLLSGYIKYSSR